MNSNIRPRKHGITKTRRRAWTFWIAAFAVLSPLGIGSADATPHAKNTRRKADHLQPVAQGTRLFTTGAVNPNTASVKAITGDNRFTWIQIPANVVIVQGGKPATADAIGEGSKVSCQGKWVDDAWGPVFQASRIEILGNIGETSLQQKVAAACQAIQGTSQSNPGDDTGDPEPNSAATPADLNVDTANLNAETDQLKIYNEASDMRRDAANRAFDELNRLGDAAENDPAMRHRPAAVRAMRDAVAQYKQALDAEDSIAPIPPVLRVSEEFSRRSNQQHKIYADLRLQYFGLKSRQGWELMRQVLAKSSAFIDEAQAALDND